MAVDLDRAGIDVVEARDQVRGGRLARARWTDQRHQLAGQRLEFDVGQAERLDRQLHGPSAGLGRLGLALGRQLHGGRRVAEGHVAEAHVAAHADRVERHRIRRVGDLVRHLQVLEDPVEQGQRALDLDLDVEQLAEREEEAALQRGEGHDRADADRRVALDDQRAGQQVDERRRDAEEDADHGEEPAADHLLPDLQVAQPPRLLGELLDAGPLLPERLRQQDAGDATATPR